MYNNKLFNCLFHAWNKCGYIIQVRFYFRLTLGCCLPCMSDRGSIAIVFVYTNKSSLFCHTNYVFIVSAIDLLIMCFRHCIFSFWKSFFGISYYKAQNKLESKSPRMVFISFSLLYKTSIECINYLGLSLRWFPFFSTLSLTSSLAFLSEETMSLNESTLCCSFLEY